LQSDVLRTHFFSLGSLGEALPRHGIDDRRHLPSRGKGLSRNISGELERIKDFDAFGGIVASCRLLERTATLEAVATDQLSD
jgi:hypothetical protein